MIPVLIGLGIVFIPLGIIFLSTSAGVQEHAFDYTECLSLARRDEWQAAPARCGAFEWRTVARPAEMTSSYAAELCELRFSVPAPMRGPVLLYYRLTNYYQNQRLYVRSVVWEQLAGQALTARQLGDCSPLVSPEDRPTAASPVYYPCGLIANSMFSDQFGALAGSDGARYEFPAKGIAWASDRDRYGATQYTLEQVRPPPFWTTNADLVHPDGTYKRLPDLQHDERFQVWMRVAGLPTFRKPWGRLAGDLPAGQYTLLIDSNFEVASYGATKAVVLSTTSWMGGRNPFIGTVYIVAGSLFICFAVGFLLKHLISPRPLGDLSYLSWIRARPEA